MKKILILGGGISKERKISLETAKQVNKVLNRGFKTFICEPNNDLIKKIKTFKPDLIFNALHGRFGEDGYIQSILEKLKIKYTHSGVISSFLAMNKILSKEIFIKNNILTPKFIKFSFNNNQKISTKLLKKIEKRLKFPVVIKPINEGSSVGINLIKKNTNINTFLKNKYLDHLMEEYIPGIDLTVGLMSGKVIGMLEVITEKEIYDYES